MLYVYAITDSPAAPRQMGLHGAPLRAIGKRGTFAVVSSHDDAPTRPSEDDLWAHEGVVEALMDHATVLPMRFGSHVADEASLRTILRERGSEFEALIALVEGAVEVGVRAQLPACAPEATLVATGTAGAGTAYLRERAEGWRRSADAIARIHEPLAALARRSARGGGLTPGAFKAAYLVEGRRLHAFQDRVDDLAAEIDGASIVCTGPWPPYSFSSWATE